MRVLHQTLRFANFIASRPRLPLETISVFLDGILGKLMEESTDTANAERCALPQLAPGTVQKTKQRRVQKKLRTHAGRNGFWKRWRVRLVRDWQENKQQACRDTFDCNVNGSTQRRSFENVVFCSKWAAAAYWSWLEVAGFAQRCAR